MVLILILAAVFGACLGSFCNVLIIRLHEGTAMNGRSHCMHCRKALRPQHLVPLVSWIMLRARCAYCHKPIHWQYPLVEAAGALIGVVAVMTATNGDSIHWLTAVFTAIFLFTLLVVTTFDLRWQLVPVGFALGAGVLLGGWNIFLEEPVMVSVLSVVSGAAITTAILWLMVKLSRGRLMGDGDPYIGFLIGAALGWPLGPLVIGLAFVIGGAVAMVLLAAGTVKRKTPIPFVPFLAVAAIVAYFQQQVFLDYLQYAFF